MHSASKGRWYDYVLHMIRNRDGYVILSFRMKDHIKLHFGEHADFHTWKSVFFFPHIQNVRNLIQQKTKEKVRCKYVVNQLIKLGPLNKRSKNWNLLHSRHMERLEGIPSHIKVLSLPSRWEDNLNLILWIMKAIAGACGPDLLKGLQKYEQAQ
jgi:hypothetical protein